MVTLYNIHVGDIGLKNKPCMINSIHNQLKIIKHNVIQHHAIYICRSAAAANRKNWQW